MDEKGYLKVLENEFSAGDQSFLIQLRCDMKMTWNKEAFSRLIMAMGQCCDDLKMLKMLSDG